MPAPHPFPRLIAHRGASEQYAEQTRAAYLQALAEGADGLECDVQLTADGQAVLWHDVTVDRTSDGSGPVHEHTLAELRALDVWSWHSPHLPPDRGSTHDQVLTLDDIVTIACDAGRPVELVVELKDSPFGPALEDEVLAVLTARGWTPAGGLDKVAVSFMSFDPRPLEGLARTVPAKLLMLLFDDLPQQQPQGGAGPSIDYVRRAPEHIRELIGAGHLVRVWTVDDVDDARACLALGVPEITTNAPGRLRAELGL
ncbi:MAG: glycerophosphodiester phosphodiesterase family protein [Cellulomonadaceae bacterium]